MGEPELGLGVVRAVANSIKIDGKDLFVGKLGQ